MGYIQGEARNQQTLFPMALDDLVPADHLCRVIEAFVGRLSFQQLVLFAPKRPRQAALATILAI